MLNLDLIEQAVNGDKQALGKLIIENKQDYYRLAYSFTNNEADALDAISDMALILLKKIKNLKEISKFKTYSQTILVNCCRKIIKSRKLTFELDENISDENQYDVELLDLKTNISKLTVKLQEVIVLKYFQEMDYQTISDMLNIPLGTVKSRMNNGIFKLSKMMGGDKHE